jgi:UDP-N-acetylmuramoyl-tripeptide--D-alanyl-D-alanine ligase
MINLSIKDLIEITNARCAGDSSGSFARINIDSRTIEPGDCFFAICGENFDGHDYVADAIEKGAACAVVQKTCKPTGGCVLTVDDTIAALGQLAAHYRQRIGFKVVAITGSVGKTSTRHITHHVLSRHFRAIQSPKNFNNQIGLPITLLSADPEAEVVIAEIGADRPGEIACLTNIAQPDVAAVTNVHPAHLAGFGSIETIAREKLSIAKSLRENGTLIINGDSNLLINALTAEQLSPDTPTRIVSKQTRVIKFGTNDKANIHITDLQTTETASTFRINGTEIHLPLPGPGNVENAAAAWGLCSSLGIKIDEFAADLKDIQAVPMRAQIIEFGTINVLNDCYNANPASMRNALEILQAARRKSQQRLVFVCGDMAELGDDSSKLHHELGRLIAQSNVKLLIAIGKWSKLTAQTASQCAKQDLDTKCFDDASSACQMLQNLVKDYDVVLVKGSRAAGLEIVVERLKQLFA